MSCRVRYDRSVAEHVQCCPQCGEELALYQRLSGMAKGLADPQPSDEIWSGIEAGLDADSENTPVVRTGCHARLAGEQVVCEPCHYRGAGVPGGRYHLDHCEDVARTGLTWGAWRQACGITCSNFPTTPTVLSESCSPNMTVSRSTFRRPAGNSVTAGRCRRTAGTLCAWKVSTS